MEPKPLAPASTHSDKPASAGSSEPGAVGTKLPPAGHSRHGTGSSAAALLAQHARRCIEHVNGCDVGMVRAVPFPQTDAALRVLGETRRRFDDCMAEIAAAVGSAGPGAEQARRLSGQSGAALGESAHSHDGLVQRLINREVDLVAGRCTRVFGLAAAL